MRLKWVVAAFGLALVFGAWAWLAGDGAGFLSHAFAELIIWMHAQQRTLHRDLIAAIRAVSLDTTAQWALVTLSFGYGVFHAAGPGHGKAILATYLVTHPAHVSRGVALAVASALCQGLVAVALVYGLILVAGWIPRELTQATAWAERASFILVMLMGALLIARAAGNAWKHVRLVPARSHAGHNHGPAHDHGTGHGDGGQAACGHHHGPTADQIARAGSLGTAVGVVLSIGIRPCTGAVLVLVLAHVLNLVVAGALAVLAMSLGTAITVAVLAFGSVHLRGWIGRMAEGRGAGWMVSLDVLAALGGAFLVTTGYALLAAASSPPHPLGL